MMGIIGDPAFLGKENEYDSRMFVTRGAGDA